MLNVQILITYTFIQRKLIMTYLIYLRPENDNIKYLFTHYCIEYS